LEIFESVAKKYYFKEYKYAKDLTDELVSIWLWTPHWSHFLEFAQKWGK